jgi:hypothetical protein
MECTSQACLSWNVLFIGLLRFLHASLQLDQLEKSLTVGDLRDQLGRCPPGINMLYANTLEHITQSCELDARRGKEILLWAVFGRGVLALKDLQSVLALDPQGAFHSQHIIPQDSIISLSHGLIMVESKTQRVYLFRAFLCRSSVFSS